MGGPGAGKGTVSSKIVESFKVKHISTGDIFRSEISNETKLGLEAKGYIEKGLLVPDELTNAMVASYIEANDCSNGYLLDGYPRTLKQAEAFDKIVENTSLEVDCVLVLDIPFEALEARITGRRLCKDCGAIYHITNKPSKQEGVCDVCGGTLYQRKDDTVESLKVRLDEYSKNALPLQEYYKNKLIVVQANQSSDQVWNDILVALEAK